MPVSIIRLKFIIVLFLLVVQAGPLSAQGPAGALSAAGWQKDLSWLVQKLEDTHPEPFRAISKPAFGQKVDLLRNDIPHLRPNQIAARMMQVVASLNDGHTSLEPAGFNRWFPLRCYRFRDGLFITAIQREYQKYAGSRVVKFGNVDPDTALALCASLKGSNNRFGALENSVLYLSNADLLQALGITDDPGNLTLRVARPDGESETIRLSAQTIGGQTNWMQWGEMYGPVPDLSTFFGARVSGDYRKGDKDLPLHLRMRLPYWFQYLPESKTVYFQFNFVEKQWKGTTFQQFRQGLFSFIDSNDVRKFVIDLRYNSGGDGSLLDPFLHEIIRRDNINQKGRLFVLVGRKTFSAAVLLLGSLKRHTNASFAGEPAGAPLNHDGDPESYILPASKFVLNVSTVFHQAGDPKDKSLFFPVDFPCQFTSHDYFSGADPVLDLVTKTDPVTVCDMFLRNGGEAMAAYAHAADLKKEYSWFTPFTEEEMNRTGYRLVEQGRIKDAIQAFLLNAETFPGSWNVWDSLAEAYMTDGNNELAAQYYRKSLELNPGNENARNNLEKLKHPK